MKHLESLNVLTSQSNRPVARKWQMYWMLVGLFLIHIESTKAHSAQALVPDHQDSQTQTQQEDGISKQSGANGPANETATRSKDDFRVSIVYSDSYLINLGGLENMHPFDIKKYQKIHGQLIADGLLTEDQTHHPTPLDKDDLGLIHHDEYLKSLNSRKNIARYLEAPILEYAPLPLDRAVLSPFRHASGGTFLAAECALKNGIGINIGGGYHHAKPNTGEGFCVYADIPIAIRKLQNQKKIQKAVVIDVDVHQGNGTAVCLADDDTTFCFSMHERDLYPIPKETSDLDVEMEAGMGDKEYLEMLEKNLKVVFSKMEDADICFIVGGCDTLFEDPLAATEMTVDGIVKRDQMIVQACVEREIPVVITTAGGYSPEAWQAQYKSFKNLIEYYGLEGGPQKNVTTEDPNPAGTTNWPQFRGYQANGTSPGTPPLTWDVASGNNIAWKANLEGLGHSAPIVWGDSVFLTTAVNENSDKPSLQTGWLNGTGDSPEEEGIWTWKLISLDLQTGERNWVRECVSGEPEIQRHLKASHANCTPATDGESVVAFFGSEGLFCFDFAGNLRWQKDLGRLHSGPYNAKELEWGFASSPVIHDGHVIVQCDCLNTGFVSILNLEDGSEVRRIERNDVATWSTPAILESDGTTQIICNGFKQMAAYDFESGQQRWTISGGGDVPVPTPLIHNKTVFITNGHGRSPIYAVAANAQGDLTLEKDQPLPDGLRWYQPRGGSYMPTPIIVEDLIYVCNDNGVLTVRETETGELVYKQRVSTGQNVYSASAVGTKQHLYFAAENGTVTVIKTGREYESIAMNEMGDTVMATPAIAGDRMLIRTVDELICIYPGNEK